MDTSPYAQRGNLALAIGATLVAVLAGIAYFGPGSAMLSETRDEMADHYRDLESWAVEERQVRAITPDEIEAWTGRFERTKTLLGDPVDEASLFARVGSALDTPSLQHLEVVKRVAEGARRPDRHVLTSPTSGEVLEVEEIPIRVAFRASYRDTLRVLRRIESGRIPLRLDEIDLRRDYPALRVEIGARFFARKRAADRGEEAES